MLPCDQSAARPGVWRRAPGMDADHARCAGQSGTRGAAGAGEQCRQGTSGLDVQVDRQRQTGRAAGRADRCDTGRCPGSRLVLPRRAMGTRALAQRGSASACGRRVPSRRRVRDRRRCRRGRRSLHRVPDAPLSRARRMGRTASGRWRRFRKTGVAGRVRPDAAVPAGGCDGPGGAGRRAHPRDPGARRDPRRDPLGHRASRSKHRQHGRDPFRTSLRHQGTHCRQRLPRVRRRRPRLRAALLFAGELFPRGRPEQLQRGQSVSGCAGPPDGHPVRPSGQDDQLGLLGRHRRDRNDVAPRARALRASRCGRPAAR